jgi:hypothetical protein
MIFVLSGEGITDLGACTNALGLCEGNDFRIGPMTTLLSQMSESKLGYAILDTPDSLHYIDEPTLCKQAKASTNRLQSARGKKMNVETGYFHSNAMALGCFAKRVASEADDLVVAVLFRDSDGTRSSPNTLWRAKWQSMHDGFMRAGFEYGVPMIPKPKSESWLLCCASTALQNCAHLELMSGNDNSPDSVKARLDVAMGGHKSGEELCDWLMSKPVDVEKIASMPSFKAFKDALNSALDRVLH